MSPCGRIFFGSVLTLAVGWAAAVIAADASDDLVPVIVELLGDKDKDIRALGLEQVRTVAKGEAATKQFAAQLPKLSTEAQVGLLSALADRGDPAARSAVVELLAASRDEAVRAAAWAALGALGEPADVPRLVGALASPSRSERAAAQASLVRLHGDVVPGAIVAQWKSAPSAVRVKLIEILAVRRARTTIPDLLTAAIDADQQVRAAAMAALGQMAGPEHLPGMVQGVLHAQRGAERTAAERAVAAVCGRLADANGRATPLLAAMEKLSEADRLAMLPTVGRVGGKAALSAVESAIADAASHDAGLIAVCNWPDASIAERLIQLATTDQHPPHRTLALKALIRVAPLPDGRPDAERLALVKRVMAMCSTDADRGALLSRARAIRTVESLRFVVPYLNQPPLAQTACETIVELAHHRALRDAHKEEFHAALDRVIALSKDAVVVERAQRYQRGQTWAKPTPTERS